MGWQLESLKTAMLPDGKLCALVGESLRLGCIGLVLLLIYFVPKAPWWDPLVADSAIKKVRSDRAQIVASASAPVAKKQRRTGLLRKASVT